MTPAAITVTTPVTALRGQIEQSASIMDRMYAMRDGQYDEQEWQGYWSYLDNVDGELVHIDEIVIRAKAMSFWGRVDLAYGARAKYGRGWFSKVRITDRTGKAYSQSTLDNYLSACGDTPREERRDDIPPSKLVLLGELTNEQARLTLTNVVASMGPELSYRRLQDAVRHMNQNPSQTEPPSFEYVPPPAGTPGRGEYQPVTEHKLLRLARLMLETVAGNRNLEENVIAEFATRAEGLVNQAMRQKIRAGESQDEALPWANELKSRIHRVSGAGEI